MNAELPRKADDCVEADRAGDADTTRMRSVTAKIFIAIGAMRGLAVAYAYRDCQSVSAFSVTIMDTNGELPSTVILCLTRGCRE